MKTLQILTISLVCSFLSLSVVFNAEGRIVPQTILQLYKESDMILVGNVTSIEIPTSGIHTFYHVKVEQYLKNPQQNDTITVVGSGPNDGHPPPDPKFVVGDRIRLYLLEENGTYMISMYSTKANPKCSAHELLGLGPREPIPRGGYDTRYSEINCGPPFVSMYTNYDSFLPPEIQFKSGVTAQDTECNRNLVHIIKAKDDSPACVKPDTAKLLSERGWAVNIPVTVKETTKFGNDHESVLCFARLEDNIICPGEHILHSCPIILFNTNSTVIAKSGFVGVYHYIFYADNYVLEPGHNGTITYILTANHPQYSGPPLPQKIPHDLNITNYATFFHQKTIPLNDIQKYSEIHLVQGEGGAGSFYSTCYELPYSKAESCSGSQATGDSVSLLFYDHPGVNVSFDKKSETIGPNDSATITMTISVSPEAQKGTYWMVVSPGICMGGEIILLTIGDHPYS